MKRLTTGILALVMVLALCACGSKPVEMGDNEIKKLVDEGYYCAMSTYDETMWRGVFTKSDDSGVYQKVLAPFTAELYEAFSSLSWDDEQYEDKQLAILSSLTGVEVTDLSDQVPSQEELDAFVGKTLGDMAQDGFEQTGWSGLPEEGYSFYLDGPVYSLTVKVTEKIEDMDDYSPNDILALEIAEATFANFAEGVLMD